jgi:uncharacterized membrane protein
MAKRTRNLSDAWLPARMARLHGRLVICTLIGIAVCVALSVTDWRLATCLLTGWDVGVALYLVLTFWMMRNASIAEIRKRAGVQDEGALALLILIPGAAIASLVAITFQVARAPDAAPDGWLGLVLGMGTILLSWFLVHTIFALHYAHEFYGEGRDSKVGGLDFPGGEDPDYWDFLYFSFVIAMTSQVSDVQVTGRIMRRIVNAHGVLSFFFNLSVLALTVNMLSNLINPSK